jgi:hypothetical protein
MPVKSKKIEKIERVDLEEIYQWSLFGNPRGEINTVILNKINEIIEVLNASK